MDIFKVITLVLTLFKEKLVFLFLKVENIFFSVKFVHIYCRILTKKLHMYRDFQGNPNHFLLPET